MSVRKTISKPDYFSYMEAISYVNETIKANYSSYTFKKLLDNGEIQYTKHCGYRFINKEFLFGYCDDIKKEKSTTLSQTLREKEKLFFLVSDNMMKARLKTVGKSKIA